MKNCIKKILGETYSDKIRWRIRVLWCVLIAMLIYMVVIGEIGGDSRIMTDLANIFSGITFFGGIVMDILLLCLLFVTLTVSLFNMPAFYTSFVILLVAVGLRTIAYLVYSRM